MTTQPLNLLDQMANCDLYISTKCGQEQIKEEDLIVLRVKGEYQNPAGFSEADQSAFSESLKRFLLDGVTQIKQFESFVQNKTVLFAAEFHMRVGRGEEFLFNLENWPLGVRRLGFV